MSDLKRFSVNREVVSQLFNPQEEFLIDDTRQMSEASEHPIDFTSERYTSFGDPEASIGLIPGEDTPGEPLEKRGSRKQNRFVLRKNSRGREEMICCICGREEEVDRVFCWRPVQFCTPWWLFCVINYHAWYRDVAGKRVKTSLFNRLVW